MNQSEPNPKSRIIIDEDWKSQVERERQKVDASDEPQTVPGGPIPDQLEVNFDLLVSMLITPALMSLGQQVDPRQPMMPVDLPQARLYIDLLGVLRQRTQGNLAAEEDEMLEAWIEQLQLLYVNTYSQQQKSN
ncbi:MAG: DUF1844 domain-containing protein [Pirellulales bacterium]